MKIVPKLTLALLLGSSIVLAANAFLRVRREIAFFEANRIRDHEMIGRSVSAAFSAVSRSEGHEAALATVEAVNAHFSGIHIRWQDLDARKGAKCQSRSVPSGSYVTCIEPAAEGDTTWLTYIPVEVNGAPHGAIELSESATAERMFAHGVIVDTLRATLALVLLSAIVAFVMGQWLVGRPVRALAAAARRIGQGHFDERVRHRPRDELGLLADEMNAMSDRLSATLAQLRHADRLATVGKLAAGVAHELGTPLNVVLARASMISSGDTSPEESREYARVISTATERMTRIIRDLLQFARRSGPKTASCDVCALSRTALDLLHPLAAKRSVRLEVSSDADVPLVQVDAGQIQQVVTNLVMNAIHAMPKGGTVTLRFARRRACPPADAASGVEGDYLCVSVEDEGDGIAPDVLPHIFEPFFTTKDVGEGTGLGLPVSYGIVRDHGGWIAVDSKIGEGTTFEVYLPLAQA